MHRNVSFLLKSIAKLPLISVVKRGDPWKLLCYTEQIHHSGFQSLRVTQLWKKGKKKGGGGENGY